MGKTFNIYCDESTHLEKDGQPYMVYSYVSVAYNQMNIIKEQIKQLKIKHNYNEELKWTNVSDKTYGIYKDIIDYFFITDMDFRAVIVDKSQIDNTRSDYTFNDFYFRMYFQLLHHKIDMENTYNVYFDIKDTCSQKKLHRLKDILKWNASLRNFQFIKSHESLFIQITDVLMGALNYNIRIERGALEGKSISKRKIIDLIKTQSNLSLSKSTYKSEKKFNLFFIDLK